MSIRGTRISTLRVTAKREIVACECDTEMIDNNNARANSCDECQRRSVIEWVWDDSDKSRACQFENNARNIRFHTTYSTGTAGVRGTEKLIKGHHHYWEIEMSTEVYGTDMMIGVGTEQTDLGRFKTSFVSLIGKDEHSWGLSYNGTIHHAGESHKYMEPFGQHAIIGVHLNMWQGTLEYYLNRKPMGIAFRNLQDKLLYPMISSTAARSGMNLINCRSYPASLELQSLLTIGKNLFEPENTSLFKRMDLPPGLLRFIKNNYWWISTNKEVKEKSDVNKESSSTSRVTMSIKRPREKSPSAFRIRKMIVAGKPLRNISQRTTTTRSMSKTKMEMTGGPATAAKNRCRNKTLPSTSTSSSSSSSSSTTTPPLGKTISKTLVKAKSTKTKAKSNGKPSVVIKESRNKRRFIDSKNNFEVKTSKKK